MNEKEMLELAGKAAGILPVSDDLEYLYDAGDGLFIRGNGTKTEWYPLSDDGDALRLAVDANIEVLHAPAFKEAHAGYYVPSAVLQQYAKVPWGSDKMAATRLAITRAAAEVGRSMP